MKYSQEVLESSIRLAFTKGYKARLLKEDHDESQEEAVRKILHQIKVITDGFNK